MSYECRGGQKRLLILILAIDSLCDIIAISLFAFCVCLVFLFSICCTSSFYHFRFIASLSLECPVRGSTRGPGNQLVLGPGPTPMASDEYQRNKKSKDKNSCSYHVLNPTITSGVSADSYSQMRVCLCTFIQWVSTSCFFKNPELHKYFK